MKTISDSLRAKQLLDSIKGLSDGEAMTLMREQFREVRRESIECMGCDHYTPTHKNAAGETWHHDLDGRDVCQCAKTL